MDQEYVIRPKQVYAFLQSLTVGERVALYYSKLDNNWLLSQLKLKTGDMGRHEEYRAELGTAVEKFGGFLNQRSISPATAEFVKTDNAYILTGLDGDARAAAIALFAEIKEGIIPFAHMPQVKKIMDFCAEGYEHFPGKRHEGPDNVAIFNEALKNAKIEREVKSGTVYVRLIGNSNTILKHGKYWDFLQPVFERVVDLSATDRQKNEISTRATTAYGAIVEFRFYNNYEPSYDVQRLAAALIYNAKLEEDKTIDLLEERYAGKPGFFVVCAEAVSMVKGLAKQQLGE